MQDVNEKVNIKLVQQYLLKTALKKLPGVKAYQQLG